MKHIKNIAHPLPFCSLAVTLFGLLSVLLLVQSCTEPITIHTDNSPPVVVIYSVITSELKVHEVNVSRSSPYFDDVPNQGLSDATVSVYSTTANYLFQECDTLPGTYRSIAPFSAEAGTEYTLKVEVDFNGNVEIFEAQTPIIPVPELDSVTIRDMPMFGRKGHALYIHALEPPGKDFYLLNLFKNDTSLTAKLTDFITEEDNFFEDQYIEMMVERFRDGSEWEDDRVWASDEEKVRARRRYLWDGDTITLQLCVIPEGFFNFISQSKSVKNGGNPMFGGPASNVITNISNGGVGYFAGYAISEGKVVYKEEKED
ncbi:hypothetical protein FACS1894121_0160 [Bacteroidia bacterium]|nr:hypothetical protein FACS1894121_0160 [Bacteroidia bacterium]